MSAPTAARTGPPTAVPSAVVDPAVRGRTMVLDRVVEKTAAAAAAEVNHVDGSGRGAVGQLLGSIPTVGVRAAIDGHLCQLRLDVEIDYPAPLRQVTRRLREHVTERVGQLCAITVTDCDIHVVALRQHTRPERRVQ